MDKDIVKARFAKAVRSYDDNAPVQRQIAVHLCNLMAEHAVSCTESPWPSRVLEIGCGTGLLTRTFLKVFCPDMMWLNDLCPEVAPVLEDILGSGRTGFIPGDAENVAFPDSLDLIMSSSAVQWLEDLPAFLDKCSSSLGEGGILAFSSFGPLNMNEIAVLEGITMPYRTLSELTGLASGKFDIIHAEESSCILEFASPSEVLRHMKLTGVTGLKKEAWTRSRLESFCRRYMEMFSDHDGTVRLTYHPVYVIARKK